MGQEGAAGETEGHADKCDGELVEQDFSPARASLEIQHARDGAPQQPEFCSSARRIVQVDCPISGNVAGFGGKGNRGGEQ